MATYTTLNVAVGVEPLVVIQDVTYKNASHCYEVILISYWSCCLGYFRNYRNYFSNLQQTLVINFISQPLLGNWFAIRESVPCCHKSMVAIVHFICSSSPPGSSSAAFLTLPSPCLIRTPYGGLISDKAICNLFVCKATFAQTKNIEPIEFT